MSGPGHTRDPAAPVRGVPLRALRASGGDLERTRLHPPGLGELARQAHRVVEGAGARASTSLCAGHRSRRAGPTYSDPSVGPLIPADRVSRQSASRIRFAECEAPDPVPAPPPSPATNASTTPVVSTRCARP